MVENKLNGSDFCSIIDLCLLNTIWSYSQSASQQINSSSRGSCFREKSVDFKKPQKAISMHDRPLQKVSFYTDSSILTCFFQDILGSSYQ